MIRLDLPDIPTTDRLIEALYVAAGAHPCTAQGAEWRRIAADLEQALDQLPPQPLPDIADQLLAAATRRL